MMEPGEITRRVLREEVVIQKVGRWRYRGRIVQTVEWQVGDNKPARPVEECVYPTFTGVVGSLGVVNEPRWLTTFGWNAEGRLEERLLRGLEKKRAGLAERRTLVSLA